MPAMVAFSRRWLVGTDDMILMGIPDMLCYFSCMVWSSLETCNWFSSEERQFCADSLSLDIGLSTFLANVTVAFVLGIAFTYVSTRGTIFQVEARSACATLFHIKTICVLLNLLNLGYTYHLLHVGNFCNSSSMKMALLVAAAAQTVFAVVQLTFWWMIFDDDGRISTEKTKKKPTEMRSSQDSILGTTIKKWKLRLLTSFLWLVSPSKCKKSAVRMVPGFLKYIPRERNIVFTDVFAGILWMEQKHLKYFEKEELRVAADAAITLSDGSPVECFPTTDMPPWMNLHLAKRYFQIGKGIFESSLTTGKNAVSFLCSFWEYLMNCLQWRKQSVVEEDTCSAYSMADPLIESKFSYKDRINVSFANKDYIVPFFVTVDVLTMSVVISIGGTMSFDDVLTTLEAGLEHMEDSGYPKDILFRADILNAAEEIRKKLADKGILEAAFRGRKGYHLISTGHSMGAGVATALAFLLRPAYPTIRCFAFEPPPCVNGNALQITFDFVFSLVFGNDILPFLNWKNVGHMVNEVVKCAEDYNMPKYKVLFYSLPEYGEGSTLPQDEREDKMSAVKSMRMSAHGPGQSSEEEGAQPDNPAKQKEDMPSFDESNADGVKHGKQMNKSYFQQPKKTALYIPGRVLHIRHSKKGYRLQIRRAQDFHTLLIRPDMEINHFSQYVEECLEELGRTYILLSESL